MSNDVNGRCSESRRSGRVPSHPGLTIVTGMNGHGFGISMGVGEAVAQMLTSSQNSSRLAEFSLSRFSERYFHKPMNVPRRNAYCCRPRPLSGATGKANPLLTWLPVWDVSPRCGGFGRRGRARPVRCACLNP